MNETGSTIRAKQPRVGMLAKLRNRRGIIVSVDPFDAPPDGRFHLVRVEYSDADGVPEDTVVWERESDCDVIEPHALPRVADEPPMKADEFDALVRATRWSALCPFLDPRDPSKPANPSIAAPMFGAVEVDDFQLVPLVRALEMPRIALLLADDVGLGKTVEAGLVLSELLIRRRIRRVLILTPASLRYQWKKEMQSKFALSFDLIDRAETHALQRRLGLDANPWRTFPRIICSYHYLRQPDVQERFLATTRPTREGGTLARLPWDLLIVDEVHNLMPANFGEDSDLAQMLRAISPHFEHKLFLSATPHNGHTRCFTGLLEQLDPVRYTQKAELSEAEKARIEEVVVRRLKREINDLDDKARRPRRFAERKLVPLPLFFGARERALSAALARFRKAVKSLIATSNKTERLAGSFAIEVLVKRLLSCPYAFAESWHRFKAGLQESEAAHASEVTSAVRSSQQDLDDDAEIQGRENHAAHAVGAWLKPFLEGLEAEVAAIDSCLLALGLRPEDGSVTNPNDDARFVRLERLIDEHLRSDNKWRNDERLIVFTEYKTTLDYLARRMTAKYADAGQRIRMLFGGMEPRERDAINDAFNDPADPVRLLVATDTASEGLNLQETARLLVHYEIPWSPIRLEQRNGRLDRYGQARDVLVHHFTSDDDADFRFTARVVAKVEEIREDLGSFNELFDDSFRKRFIDGEDAEPLFEAVESTVKQQRARTELPRRKVTDTGERALADFKSLAEQVELSPESLSATLRVALGIGTGRSVLEGPDATGRMRLREIPSRWKTLIDDTVRLPAAKGGLGAIPALVFDPRHFLKLVGTRPVFRSEKDTLLLHLGHPVFRQALAEFARARFPGGSDRFMATRWIVRRARLPKQCGALLRITVEELAVNELRESFHHWVRTLHVPVHGGRLQAPLAVTPIPAGEGTAEAASNEDTAMARAMFDEIAVDVRDLVRDHAARISSRLSSMLEKAREQAIGAEEMRFKERINEIRASIRTPTLKKLERELKEARDDARQRRLIEEDERDAKDHARFLEEEYERRTKHYEDLLQLLKENQSLILEEMLPRRYRLSGDVQAFPVAIEILLPEEAR